MLGLHNFHVATLGYLQNIIPLENKPMSQTDETQRKIDKTC